MAQQKKSVKLKQDYVLPKSKQQELEADGWEVLTRRRSEVVFVREKAPAKKKAAKKKTAKKK